MDVIPPSIWSFTAAATVSVSGGTIDNPCPAQQEETLHRGVKLVLLLGGSLECRFPAIGTVQIKGPCLCAVLNDGDHSASQSFDPVEAVRYVIVAFDHATGATLFGADGARLAHPAGMAFHGSTPRLICRPIGKALAGLGQQMLTCPLRPDAAALYMLGKGLELGGLAAEALVSGSQDDRIPRLSTSDVERLHEARRLLLDSLGQAPDVAALSRQVGLNARKLTKGFETLFGMTPSNFLQLERLKAAHHMIATGEWSIAQAAWHVGYTPAAFSTAFRRRFGVPPSALRT